LKAYKHMTEKEFKKLKAMLDAGVPQSTVVKVTGRSITTVNQVAHSGGFNAYEALTAAKFVARQNGLAKPTANKNDDTVLSVLKRIESKIDALTNRKGLIL